MSETKNCWIRAKLLTTTVARISNGGNWFSSNKRKSDWNFWTDRISLTHFGDLAKPIMYITQSFCQLPIGSILVLFKDQYLLRASKYELNWFRTFNSSQLRSWIYHISLSYQNKNVFDNRIQKSKLKLYFVPHRFQGLE